MFCDVVASELTGSHMAGTGRPYQKCRSKISRVFNLGEHAFQHALLFRPPLSHPPRIPGIPRISMHNRTISWHIYGVDIHGHPCKVHLSMDIHGHPWTSMDRCMHEVRITIWEVLLVVVDCQLIPMICWRVVKVMNIWVYV